ncbi:hypothetical protein CGCS363_v001893 [Colletotrichum siamense]|uniref:uncharacterized protein n=1 Tax=Colletotrichum siamense TaxID=690259 RepID=UPI0018726E21|nr:uncharacterized protein CGCS363_v001893 [Colletotrichum siamense]KAF5515969.1 hypothetical protein CGCS363_v001893 [Colletotrichum siamense]
MAPPIDQPSRYRHAVCLKLLHAVASSTHPRKCRCCTRRKEMVGYWHSQSAESSIPQQLETGVIGSSGIEFHPSASDVSTLGIVCLATESLLADMR